MAPARRVHLWSEMHFAVSADPCTLLALRDYERQKKAGLNPVFDPLPLGIKNADLWRERLVPPVPCGE
ncbi:hypothetical protein [Xanthomonas graminis]|nr:hypothetical protein [Xanthomonas translucens]UKE56522.1 hypothetical protein KFS84_15510 [Xanthomonas translucens pv. graminis]WIH10786.1 hypothetical protein KM579_16060 [Xanthomonas translucens pv. graminis]WIH14494.1 hypothetical protein KM563_05950 [Xanthomonas translucens pv. graminis]